MKYIDMVRSAPNKTEEVMWNSVSHISEMLEQLDDKVPDMVRDFLMVEYESMFGNRFNKDLAQSTVADMWHKTSNGEVVKGEMVRFDESSQISPSQERCWDAYVGVNAMAHDLSNLNFSISDILRISKDFWFKDSDFDGDSKVFWYFKNK